MKKKFRQQDSTSKLIPSVYHSNYDHTNWTNLDPQVIFKLLFQINLITHFQNLYITLRQPKFTLKN